MKDRKKIVNKQESVKNKQETRNEGYKIQESKYKKVKKNKYHNILDNFTCMVYSVFKGEDKND